MTDKKESPQEIDLIELFTNIFNWLGKQIQWAYKIGLRVFYFGVRNSPWFALSIIIGAAFGYSLRFQQTKVIEENPYYKSQLVGFSHTISNIEIIKSVNNWDFSQAFGEDTLEYIKDIGATYVLDINKDGKWDVVEDIESVDTHDSITVKQRQYGNFCIMVELNDSLGFDYIPTIKEKAIDYITNNKRAKELNYMRIKQQQELIPIIEREMKELDSLKRLEYFANKQEKTLKFGENVFVSEKTKKLYHNDVMALYKQKQALERALYLYKDPIEIVLDFSIPTLAEDEEQVKKIQDLTGKYAKLGLILGFFIIVFFDQRKFIMLQIRRSREDAVE